MALRIEKHPFVILDGATHDICRHFEIYLFLHYTSKSLLHLQNRDLIKVHELLAP